MFWHPGAQPKPHHRQPMERGLTIHHNPVALHEMHMKDVPYINHWPVKFQGDFSFSFFNIVYLSFSNEFFCRVIV